MAAVRSSFAEQLLADPAASPERELPGDDAAPQSAAGRAFGRVFGRAALKVRRPAAAGAAAAAPPPPPPPPQPEQQQAPQPAPAPPPFMFGTPGAGPSGVKARRAKGRSPQGAAPPAPSPAFTTGSTASMAWSPYPSSSAEASTAFGGGAAPAGSPPPPGSATPTSGAAAAAAAADESPVASVAADLRERLDLSGGGSSGSSSSGSLPAELRDRLHLGGEQRGAAPPAPAGAAAAPSRPAPFSFVFGAAAAASVPSPRAGRAAFRKKPPSPSSSASSAAGSRPSSAAAAPAAPAAPAAAEFPSMPRPQSAAAQAPGGSEAATAAGPTAAEAAAAVPQAAAPAGFVFGASGDSPAALRARHRARSATRSPQQPAAAPDAAPGSAGSEAENQQRAAQQPAAGEQQAGFVRLGDVGKPGAAGGSPIGFAAAGGTARRPPASRRKGAHPTRSSGSVGTPQRQPSQEAASPAPPAAAAAAAAPRPHAPAAAGRGDAQAQAQAQSRSEMYRSQGNEAFRDGDYPAAYDLYTKAVQALWPHPPLHPRLALLLSNRAAALLSQGKPLSALADCQMGLKYDPSLMRCALRVATCHSRLGDFDEAFACVARLREVAAGNPEQLKEVEAKQRDLEEQERQMYEALRSLGHALAAPRRDPVTGAALQRSASSGSGMSRAGSSSAPAAPATSEAFWEALKRVDDIAPHVPHSELVLAAKAEGLLRLGKLERAKEFTVQAVHEDDNPHHEQHMRAPWRLWVKAQCSWAEGDAGGLLKQQLTDLLAALERQAQRGGGSIKGATAAGGAAPSAFFPAAAGAAQAASSAEQQREAQLAQLVGLPSADDVRALLEGLSAADRLRLAGNAAVKAGKAAEAVQKYSEALAAASGLSPAIAAVLLSNRAAAHQHLKQRAQAIADCCRSVALNPHYAKAHSRLATLLSELGYHSDAATALEAAVAAPGVSSPDRREYQKRLDKERVAARRADQRAPLAGAQAALDHYKLLGLERTAGAEEVRRAYKKLALQLHPDKAATAVRLALRCAGCGSPLFEAAAAQARLQERATWLFKLLGEANEVLSDASKRRDLDHALRMAAASSRGSPSAFGGGFSSYYGGSDDEDGAYDFFASGLFGRRGSARGASSGASGYGAGGYGYSRYGAYGARGGNRYGGYGGYY